MDEQQDAFGGQFFQIGVLYSWLMWHSYSDFIHHHYRWWAYFHVEYEKGTWLSSPWYEARCSKL